MRESGTSLRRIFTFLGGLAVLLSLIGIYMHVVDDPISALEKGERLPSWFGSDLGGTLYRQTGEWPMLFGVGLILIACTNPRVQLSQWHLLVSDLELSPIEFYRAIREDVHERKTPAAHVGPFHACQRGALGSFRKYLRIRSGYFRFELMAAPYGSASTLSWRCYYKMPIHERALLAVPILGWLAYYLFFRYTTYTEDRGLSFQSSVKSSVDEVLSAQLSDQGLGPQDLDRLTPLVSGRFGT